MDKEVMFGPINSAITDNSLMMRDMDWEIIFGQTIENMKAVGQITTFMDMEYTHKQMDHTKKVSGLMANSRIDL